MMLSVQGDSRAMEEARRLHPGYMDKIGHGREDDPINEDLVFALVALGLRVKINEVLYEPGFGPYCPLPEADLDDADEEDEDDDF